MMINHLTREGKAAELWKSPADEMTTTTGRNAQGLLDSQCLAVLVWRHEKGPAANANQPGTVATPIEWLGVTMNDFTAHNSAQSTDKALAFHAAEAIQSTAGHEEVGYFPVAFISCALPYRDPRKRTDLLTPAEAFSWTRQNGPVSLNLTAGTYIDGAGQPQVHLPYGRYARILLMWLTTSALKHQSRSFPLPTSARALLEELGIDWSRSQARDIITQLRALLAAQCVVTHHDQRGNNFVSISEERFTIGTRARLHFSTDENFGDFDPSAPSYVELSEAFYAYISAGNIAPVLLDRWRELITTSNSPMAADLFLWLAFRAPQISHDTRISWANLQTQLGSVTGRERNFIMTATRALKKVSEVYPEMNFSVMGEGSHRGFKGVILHPSPDADLLGLNPRLHHQELAKAQAAAERAGLSEPATVRRDVNLNQLRAELVHGGLKAAESASDELLKAAVDVVLNRATKKPAHPQAFVRVSIAKEPELLAGYGSVPTVTPAPAAGAPAPAATLPVEVCPVHHETVSGLVCTECAVDLKTANTDQEQAAACWSAIRARLTRLQGEGVDTSGAWMANAQFANRRGL